MKDKGLPKGIARGDSVVVIYGKRPETHRTIWYGSVATRVVNDLDYEVDHVGEIDVKID